MFRIATAVLGWTVLTAPVLAQNEPVAPAPEDDPTVVKIRLGGDRHAPGTVYYEFEAGAFWADAPKVHHAVASPAGVPIDRSDDDGVGFFTRGTLGYVTPEALLPPWFAPTTRIEVDVSHQSANVHSHKLFDQNDEVFAIDGVARGTDASAEFGASGFFRDEHTVTTTETTVRVVGHRDDGITPHVGLFYSNHEQDFDSDARAAANTPWLNESLETDITGVAAGGEIRTPLDPQWTLILGTTLTYYHMRSDLKGFQNFTAAADATVKDSESFDSFALLARLGVQYDSADGLMRLSLFGEMDHHHAVPTIDNPFNTHRAARIGKTDMTTFALVGRATFFLP